MVHGNGISASSRVFVISCCFVLLSTTSPVFASRGLLSTALPPNVAVTFGSDSYGELGNGKLTSTPLPTTQTLGRRFTNTQWSSASAGEYHTCAIEDKSSTLRCWGRGTSCQLGTSACKDQSLPVALGGSFARKTWSHVSAGGNFTCATDKDTGRAYCWGSNSHGQLGVAATEKSVVKTPLAIGTANDDLTWSSISSGAAHVCAIKRSDGGLFCWGDNRYGQLGVNSTAESISVPTAVMPGSAFLAVAAGGQHTCGIMKNYSGGPETGMYCWGSNEFGQLGQGKMGVDAGLKGSILPLYVSSAWEQVASGNKHSCGFTPLRNSLSCWGDNSEGQIGFGSTDPTIPGPRPVRMMNAKDEGYLSRAAGGTASTCALTSITQRVYCWGAAPSIPSSVNGGKSGIPVKISGQYSDGKYKSIALGGSHAIALTAAA